MGMEYLYDDEDLIDDEEDEEEGKIECEADMEGWLEEAVENLAAEENKRVRVNTFQKAGMLTYNSGIVVSLDGHEFQLTIVKR